MDYYVSSISDISPKTGKYVLPEGVTIYHIYMQYKELLEFEGVVLEKQFYKLWKSKISDKVEFQRHVSLGKGDFCSDYFSTNYCHILCLVSEFNCTHTNLFSYWVCLFRETKWLDVQFVLGQQCFWKKHYHLRIF